MKVNARIYGFPSQVNLPHYLFDTDKELKKHPDYIAAKAGDQKAAVQLVSDLAHQFLLGIRNSFPKNAIFVSPFAREATGDNAIPQVLAVACAILADGTFDEGIVQVTRVFHTGADPMERMGLRAQFEGPVVRHAKYVLVDDVTSMGGTLAELSNFIQQGGGEVAGVVVLVNAGRVKYLVPEKGIIRKLKERFENEIRQIFGIRIEALTANEANYLVGFRTVDEIRNRLFKARKETDLRLRSKGIEGKV